MTVTLRFQSSGAMPGNAKPVVMHGPSLTIGRAAENDLVLPDPNREVSSRHCVIENHNGNIVAVDLSSNGTFLNYGKIPLGRTPTPLNDGDVLTLGPYELVVAVQSGQSPAELLAPADQGGVSHGNARRAPDPMSLLDDAGPGGDFLDSLLGDPAPKGPRNIRMGEDDFDGILPPLGDDEAPLLSKGREAPMGRAVADHGASASDAYRPAAPVKSVIPDDWEEDFLAPTGGGGSPSNPFGLDVTAFDQRPSRSAATPIPAPEAPPTPIPQFDLDDLVGDAAPAPETAPTETAPTETEPTESAPPPIAAPVFLPEETAAEVALPYPEPDPAPVAKPVSTPAPVPASPVSEPPPVSVLTPVEPVAAADAGAARAFLEALGMGELKLSDADLSQSMPRLGRTLKAMIVGLREILMTRTSIKSEFRIDQTMISVGGNNPLKFSITPEQAIEVMVKPTAKGYLDAEEATAQALDDIKAHEIAMVTGMEAALKGVLARLDPAELTTRIEAKGGLGGLFKGKKAQYWETYEKMYAEISDQAENDFHELFSREFAKAYKDQLARLKRGQS